MNTEYTTVSGVCICIYSRNLRVFLDELTGGPFLFLYTLHSEIFCAMTSDDS